MAFNHEFWRPYFRSVFARQVELLVAATRDRVMAAFDGIEQEAQEAADAFYDRLGRTPGSEYYDMGDAAEAAFDHGLAHFEGLDGVRQGILNLMAVALYHLFEQQMLMFYRQGVLHPSTERAMRQFSCDSATKDLSARGTDVKALSAWPSVDELRLVANAVKHGTGTSATELEGRRPDLFITPVLRGTRLGQPSRWGTPSRSLKDPLAGSGLYVELADLERYGRAVVDFWGEFGNLIARTPGDH